MKTFDLFHTLAASRSGYNAGEVPVEEHIPIVENIAKVKPDDVIVSDYHTPEKAERILREVCRLENRLICTEDGKATGRVWQTIRSESHLGDNVHTDFNSPRQRGIPAELTTQWQLTDREQECGELGWVMREARLRTWSQDSAIRGLQLYQTQRNFPFLLKVAHLLDAKVKAEGFTRLLLCSRDCCQLLVLMRALFTGYEIDYFLTSRLTRYRPSDSYAEYAKERLAGKTLVVDMNGSGQSLKFLTDMFGGTPLLVVSNTNTVQRLAFGGLRETANPAPHGMVGDVAERQAVFLNPANVNWKKPEIMEPFAAFSEAVDCLMLNPVVPSYSLESALAVMEHVSLAPLWADHLADSKAAYDLLNSGPLPHPVIL